MPQPKVNLNSLFKASPTFYISKVIKFTSNLILFQDNDELTRYEGCKRALGEKLQKKCFQLGVLLVIGNHLIICIKCFNNSDFRWVTSITATKEERLNAALTTSNAGRTILMIW